MEKKYSEAKAVHLFVCTWAPPMAGGPRNLYNHLREWDPEHYAILTSYLNFSWSKLDPATWLNCEYDFFDYAGPIERDKTAVTIGANYLRFRFIDRFDRVMGRASRLWAKLFGEFQTLFDSIYQLGRSARVLLACISFSKRRPIKSVVIVSDMGWGFIGGFLFALLFRKKLNVYLFDLYADNYMLSGNKFLAKFFEKHILRFAETIIVTNEVTAEFLKLKYPNLTRFVVVRNTSELAPRNFELEPLHYEPPFTIAFAGHIYWPQIGSIRNLIGAMDILAGLPIRLRLFVINPSDEICAMVKSKKNVDLNYLGKEKLFEELKSANLLFLPFGWDTLSDAIVNTASPAKFTDYLATGVPLLVHAPESAFVARSTRALDLGLVVSENSPSILAAKIKDYFDTFSASKKPREIGQNCVAIFRSEYNLVLNSNRLWRAINGGL